MKFSAVGPEFVLFVFLAASAIQVSNGIRTFWVSGTTLMDANNQSFVMRGVNHAHAWNKADLPAAIPAIAATGANTVRVVLSNGDRWARDEADGVRAILDLCDQHRLVAVLEVHDALSKNDLRSLDRVAQYWIDISEVLAGREDRVIINIANEWYSWWYAPGWARGYRAAIGKLRAAGLQHLLVVDTAGWGQYVGAIPKQGRRVLEADPLSRTIFSIHMYEWAGRSAAMVRRNIDRCLAVGVPVIVGEFSDASSLWRVDFRTILAHCQRRGVGWLAWSWYGNDRPNKHMDLARGPRGPLTALGGQIVDGPDGIRQTAQPASIW